MSSSYKNTSEKPMISLSWSNTFIAARETTRPRTNNKILNFRKKNVSEYLAISSGLISHKSGLDIPESSWLPKCVFRKELYECMTGVASKRNIFFLATIKVKKCNGISRSVLKLLKKFCSASFTNFIYTIKNVINHYVHS